jgi:ATP-dependent NAD(P)H-hydrate dehydratase
MKASNIISNMIIVHEVIIENMIANIRQIIPPLEFSSRKGDFGRIGILGGSVDYTGAPYYAGKASLLFGADLSFIFCASEASIPLKSYSPELMISPFYDTSAIQLLSLAQMKSMANTFANTHFPRIHSLVIGPGLGRNINVGHIVLEMLQNAKSKNLK